jgi:surface antigen
MSSYVDKSQSSPTTERDGKTTPLPWPGQVWEESPVSQLPFPETLSQSIFQTPPVTRSLSDDAGPPLVTRPLGDPTSPPLVTRVLPDLHTGGLPGARSTTTSLREPVIIRGTGKKSSGIMRPPKGRRLVVHIAVTTVLVFIVLITLIAVVPTGNEAASSFNPFVSFMNFAKNDSRNTILLPQQAATATAVTQDGFDPGSGTYAGVPGAPSDMSGGGADRFFYGQCTYWANMRYHELTGHWVPWLGNAAQWYYGAMTSGWVVSSSPHLYSIIVLQPGAQQASWYGHVAVVEKINPDGSVLTSNWNWEGNWGRETWVTFRPGPGVSFVWYPGT